MPLTHISMRAGKPDSYRAAMVDGITRALHETFDVPDDNEFVVLTEQDATNFRYSSSYLGVERSDDLVLIQVTANDGRSLAQKKALFARMADLLGDNPGIR
jgi:4-oxalocrotonate tautomerase